MANTEVQAIINLRAEFDTIREEVKLLSNLKNDVQSLHDQIQQQPTMLSEIESLRSEVQSVSHLRAEFNKTREQVKLLSSLMVSAKNVKTDDQSMHGCIQQQPIASTSASRSMLPEECVSPDVQQANVSDSFASLVKLAAGDPTAFSNTRKMKKPNKLVVGKSVNNTRLQSVETKRTVDLFISRLNPNTADDELIECVESVINDNNLTMYNVTCNRLRSKYEGLYASFHVAVDVNSVNLKLAVELLMAADSWPVGVFVKRYFKTKPKNGSD